MLEFVIVPEEKDTSLQYIFNATDSDPYEVTAGFTFTCNLTDYNRLCTSLRET